MDHFIEKVHKTIRKYNMLRPDDGVVVGISGGSDSVCLLHILYKLKKAYNLCLYAAHVNHRLRGKAADDDAAYVERLCGQLEVPVYIKTVDIKKVARERGISEEVAGREERYKFFFQIAENTGAHKIALAQNINDQAETVLMRFIRGSGAEGLAGIKPVRKDGIIRPLLEVDKQSIERYCTVQGLSPRLDETNLQPIYTRNKIRLELIPSITKEYNANFIQTAAVTADIIREDNDFFEGYVNRIVRRQLVAEAGAVSIPIDFLLNQHPAIQRKVARKAIERLTGHMLDIEYKHVRELLHMAKKKCTGLSLHLPGHIKAEVVYDKLYLSNNPDRKIGECKVPLPINGEIAVDELNVAAEAYVIDREALKDIRLNDFTKAFDYNTINEELYIRNRLPGDKFAPHGMKGTKKIKDFFIDLKIPRHKRDEIPLLATDNDILWVIGYRTSERYKCTNITKQVLIVHIKEI